jgi:SRSO17 transposase
VPETITFQTKPEIALEQIKAARAAGLPEGVVLMDAGYGNDTGLRTEITALGLRYVAGIGPNTSIWSPGAGPLPPQRGRGSGRPPKLLRRNDEHQPIAAKPAPGSNRGRSLLVCRQKRGKPLLAVRAAPTGSPRASHDRGCGRRIAIPR